MKSVFCYKKTKLCKYLILGFYFNIDHNTIIRKNRFSQKKHTIKKVFLGLIYFIRLPPRQICFTTFDFLRFKIV
jgi:hypothetical protein